MNGSSFYEFDHDVDGIKWLVDPSVSLPVVYCATHLVPLLIERKYAKGRDNVSCPLDGLIFTFANTYKVQQWLVRGLVSRPALKELKTIRIDAEGTEVLAKEHVKLNDDFWIETKLSNTTKGAQVMVQVGRRDGDKKKVQLFVDPGRQRLGFDKSFKDIHPAGLFAEVTAVFKNSSTTINTREVSQD